MVVGQKEIRGDIWLSLACGHLIRKDAFDGKCEHCERENATPEPPPPKAKAKAKPRPRKPKPQKDEYTKYEAPLRSTPSPSEAKRKYPREPFVWRGKKRQ
jgi:hypothetical protein